MLKNIWQLQDAKNKLSQLINLISTSGPQIITKRGEKKAVLLSYSDYIKLTTQENGLVEFFRDSPLAKVGLDLQRSKDFGREIDFN